MPFHLFKGKTQRGRNGMRSPGQIIAPDHDRPASSKNTLVFVCRTYLMLHSKAGAPNTDNAHTNLYGIGTHQGKYVGTCYLFDKKPIVAAIGTCLNTWIVRWMRNDAFYLLMLLPRRPLL